jgi:serine/threonine protein kinase
MPPEPQRMSHGAASCAGYRLGAELGRGGSGVVVAATHEQTGRRVAIKLLLPELSQSRQAVSRFFHEARTAARVCDPGIVEVFDSGYASDGSAFIVMAALEGESLAQRLSRAPRVTLAYLRHVGLAIARTVGTAHAQRLVHRDLKPANVFLETAPALPFGVCIKVLDFGMAKLNPDEGPYSFVTDKGALLARRCTCPRSSVAAARWTRAATCTRSAASCTKWRVGAAFRCRRARHDLGRPRVRTGSAAARARAVAAAGSRSLAPACAREGPCAATRRHAGAGT